MNKPTNALLQQPAQAFTDGLTNTAARINQRADEFRHVVGVGCFTGHVQMG